MTGLLAVAVCMATCAQTPDLPRQITKGQVVAVSVDNYNRVITADAKGNITAYDTLGNALTTYSPQTVAGVTLLEAWRSMKILVFYRDLQQYVLLDRFLTPLAGYPYPARLPAERIGFARVLTLAFDDQLWVFDDADFSLKKYNPQLQAVTIHSPMTLVLDAKDYHINFMREYQSQVFVNDKNSGILVFDNLGNYRKKLPLPNADYFQFVGDELYFADGDTLHFYNIYTAAERKVKLPFTAQLVVVVGRKIFAFGVDGGFVWSVTNE